MSEPAVILTRRPSRKKAAPAPIRKTTTPDEDSVFHTRISPVVKKRFRMSCAWYNMTKAQLLTAFSTQVNENGSFKFPWDEDAA